MGAVVKISLRLELGDHSVSSPSHWLTWAHPRGPEQVLSYTAMSLK